MCSRHDSTDGGEHKEARGSGGTVAGDGLACRDRTAGQHFRAIRTCRELAGNGKAFPLSKVKHNNCTHSTSTKAERKRYSFRYYSQYIFGHSSVLTQVATTDLKR